MTTAILKRIEAAHQIERNFAKANPLNVGDKVSLHCSGYYHAQCVVTKITDKAIALTGRPDGGSRKDLTAWFPKSALDHKASPCLDRVSHSLDVKGWFECKLNDYQQRLVGLLG